MTLSVDLATERCLEALEASPSALFTDFDGTISQMADTPSAAQLASTAGRSLGIIASKIRLVAIVTGRSARDASVLIDSPQLAIVGNHGLERIVDGAHAVDERASNVPALIAGVIREVEQALSTQGIAESLVFENKDFTGSIHYRLAPDREHARRSILEAISNSDGAADINITEGRLVIEMRPKIEIDKGVAVSALVDELGLIGCVYLGDDVADVDAFRALSRLSARGIHTISVGVVSAETNRLVEDEADITINGVDESVRLLENLSVALS